MKFAALLFFFCLALCLNARSQAVLSAPFICEWANTPGGCPHGDFLHSANCGPASVLMIADKYSGTAPLASDMDQMDVWLQTQFSSYGYAANPPFGSGTNITELAALASQYFNLPSSVPFSNWTLGQLQSELQNGFPVVVYVETFMMTHAQYNGHYMVLLGMDTQNVYVNDPGRSGGGGVAYPLANFKAAWLLHNNSGVSIHPVAAATTPQIVVVAGGGSAIPTTTPKSSLSALLQAPSGIAVDTAGNLYIADEEPALLEKMNASTGQIVVITGSGQIRASTSPIPAASANIEVEAVAIDGAGNLYIDDGSTKVDRIDASTGNVVIIAGGGSTSPSATPIAAVSANLSVYGVAADSVGNFYIASGNMVEKVDASTGKIVVVAGGGSTVPSTTPIAATSAKISVLAVAVDTQGNLFLADGIGASSLIEKLNLATGQIVVVAGGGSTVPSTTPIAATSARINALAVAADAQGNLYIATSTPGLVEKLTLAAGQIVVVAGGGNIVPSTTAAIATNSSIAPIAVTVDGAGNLYVGDKTYSTVPFGNAFVEKVTIH